MKLNIIDAKPQVGIFEIVDDILLTDTEDVSTFSKSGEYFDGFNPHLHQTDIRPLVLNNSLISKETKLKFKNNYNEYLNYPRGRVDYNTKTGEYHIMAAKNFFTMTNIEKITRAFHLPPYSSNKIVLEADEGHYGYERNQL